MSNTSSTNAAVVQVATKDDLHDPATDDAYSTMCTTWNDGIRRASTAAAELNDVNTTLAGLRAAIRPALATLPGTEFDNYSARLRVPSFTVAPEVVDHLFATLIIHVQAMARHYRNEAATMTTNRTQARTALLTRQAKRSGLDSEALDNLVHDASSRAASTANNTGIDAQIQLLLTVIDPPEIHSLLAEIAQTTSDPATA
ncbi:hypothetical protein ACIGO9_31840 [Nocardia asteroides]|uniref:hypothetical protein n=1 Tax=Nocardia asteroides TaxID=1824 RepID=UPI0037C91396